MRSAPRRTSTVSIATFLDDPLNPRVERVVAAFLGQGQVVTPVNVLIGISLLAPAGLEDWRRGRIPYIEHVIDGNLTLLSQLLRILQFHAHNLNLKPTIAVYLREGNDLKQRLRLTKTGDAKLEEAYARHFLWPGNSSWQPSEHRSGGGRHEAARERP